MVKVTSVRSGPGAVRTIIHTTPSAGYPFQVVQTSWSGEQFELPAAGLRSENLCAPCQNIEILRAAGASLRHPRCVQQIRTGDLP